MPACLQNALRSNIQNSSIPHILLGESLKWWSQTDETLQCDNKLECKLLDSFEDPPPFVKEAEAVIVIRDGFHTSAISYQSFVEGHDHCSRLKLIYFILESPYVTPIFSITNKKHEMLASYWRGSDFWLPYSIWVENENQEAEILNSGEPVGNSMELKDEGKNYAEGKTKLAAIVVSNCSPFNNRNGYVEELQKFISVDIYGDCGDLRCDQAEGITCFEYIRDDYKFYLAFENAHCRDYITEKFFFNALQNNMVPIVFGAHPEDYKAQAPKNSYIHVEDFLSPKDLAEYMLMLDNNDELYNDYFQWKSTGKFGRTNFLCDVCSMLHEMRGNPSESGNSYESKLPNGFEWGRTNNEKLCLPLKEWQWSKVEENTEFD